MIHIAIQGALGRMGQFLVRLVTEADDLALHAAIERPGHPEIGRDLGGVRITDRLKDALSGAGVLIDFSSPQATMEAARVCAEAGVAAVFGTTGLEAGHKSVITDAAGKTAIVLAPNMSVGINVTYRLVGEARRLLGNDFAPAIFESHHRWKKDAPSGTALKLGEVAGAPLEAITAIRGGDVVGEHTVFFLGDGERIEITHRATSREAFARGALRAARWVAGRKPGLYEMSDVLGI